MAVFRAPSVSSAGSSVIGDVRKMSSRLHKRSLDRTNRRPRTIPTRPSDADLAVSKARRQRMLEQRVASGPYSFVYVGNVSDKTTAAALTKLFSVCGTVLDVVIRQSYFTAKVQKGLGTVYATVHFKEPTASDKALYMSGAKLDGCELVVGRDISKMPDSHRILSKRREERLSPKRPIQRLPTLPIEGPQRCSQAGPSDLRDKPAGGEKLSTVVEED